MESISNSQEKDLHNEVNEEQEEKNLDKEMGNISEIKENDENNENNENENNKNKENNEEQNSQNESENDSPIKEKERITDSLQRIKLLPLLKTPEDAAKRLQLFDRFDPNGNLFLSLDEADKGVRDILSFGEKFLKKDVIKKAFAAAKKTLSKKSNFSAESLEKNEFRAFLLFLRQYAEYYEIFDLIETNEENKQINFEQFSVAVPVMRSYGIEIDEPKTAFDFIESFDGEKILFDDFCFWAICKNLELENDQQFDDEELSRQANME